MLSRDQCRHKLIYWTSLCQKKIKWYDVRVICKKFVFFLPSRSNCICGGGAMRVPVIIALISLTCDVAESQQSPRYLYGYSNHQKNYYSPQRHQPRPRPRRQNYETEVTAYQPRQLDYRNYRDRQIALHLQAKEVEDQGIIYNAAALFVYTYGPNIISIFCSCS